MKKKRLLIYFCIGLSLSTLLGVSFFYLRKLNALEKNIDQVGYSYQVIIQINLLEKDLQNAEVSERGYLLTGKSSFLESYVDEVRGIPEILVALDQLTLGNSLQQAYLDTLRLAINQQLELLKRNMSSDNLSDSLITASFAESNRQLDVISGVIASMKQQESSMLLQRSAITTLNTSESRASSVASLTLAFALCCIAAVCIVWFFNRNENYRRQLEDKLARLTLLNSEIKGLTLASTHNLQEPMRKVQTIIDRIQHMGGLEDKGLSEDMTRIRQIYARQQATNNTIIDYYHILSRPLNLGRVDLTEVIATVSRQKPFAEGLHVVAASLRLVIADPQQMQWLFTHIFANSLRFRHPERRPQVVVEPLAPPLDELPAALQTAEYYCVSVSDNGIGIENGYKEKIFRLFQKIDEVPDTTGQNGMGLSFCRRIMLNHGGWISARKNQQEGTTILLFFPFSTTLGK